MDGRRSFLRRVTAAMLCVAPVALAPAMAGATTHDHSVGVIVRARANRLDEVRHLVTTLGGKITLNLDIVDGIAADVPSDTLPLLAASSDVDSVTPDATVHMNDATGYGTVDAKAQLGSLYNVARMTSADDMWESGYTGAGIDVAVVDTGVAPVTGLAGRYVNGPDVSLDAFGPGTAGLDAFGHGTAMASIIAGRDPNAPTKATDL